MRAALASTLARATVWCGVARLLPGAAVVMPPPCSLDAGCAGFWAGAHHGSVRGGAWAAGPGGCRAAVVLARRRLRWLYARALTTRSLSSRRSRAMPSGSGYGGRPSWTRSAPVRRRSVGVVTRFESMVRVRTSATFRVATLLRRGSRGLACLRARVAAPAMCPRAPWLPAAARLVDPVLGAEAVRALAGDAVVDMRRALARLTGLIGGLP